MKWPWLWRLPVWHSQSSGENRRDSQSAGGNRGDSLRHFAATLPRLCLVAGLRCHHHSRGRLCHILFIRLKCHRKRCTLRLGMHRWHRHLACGFGCGGHQNIRGNRCDFLGYFGATADVHVFLWSSTWLSDGDCQENDQRDWTPRGRSPRRRTPTTAPWASTSSRKLPLRKACSSGRVVFAR